MKTSTSLRVLTLALASACMIPATGCSSAAIATKEAFGYAKREQLVTAVTKAQTDQQEAKVQFESALEEFLAVTKAEPDDLERAYRTLKKELDRSETKAADVRSRIADIERVANALFKEWKAELSKYTNADLRKASETQLTQTQDKYHRLLAVMKQAEASMDPPLAVFRDQVLFLKHNLNARAISSLQSTFGQLQTDVSTLVAEMERSIAEAETFIRGMENEGK